MAEAASRMGKTELFKYFADKFDLPRTRVRDIFDALQELSQAELKRCDEFTLPGITKLVVQKRMGRNPATGEAIKIPAKTVVKARITKQLKDSVLPKSRTRARSTRAAKK